MIEPRIDIQCWICPYCFDDHSQNAKCTVPDLKWAVTKLNEEIEVLKDRIERLQKIIIEREKFHRGL